VSLLYYYQSDLNKGPETVYPATPGSGVERPVPHPDLVKGPMSIRRRIGDLLHTISTDDGLFCLRRQMLRWVGLVATLGSGCAMALTGALC
jgi:hypothetical protein